MADSMLDPVDNHRDASGAAGTDETLEYDCPRCATMVTSHFYGPCWTCRDELRATVTAVATDIEVADYEPKMNVTPNAVALKD